MDNILEIMLISLSIIITLIVEIKKYYDKINWPLVGTKIIKINGNTVDYQYTTVTYIKVHVYVQNRRNFVCWRQSFKQRYDTTEYIKILIIIILFPLFMVSIFFGSLKLYSMINRV